MSDKDLQEVLDEMDDFDRAFIKWIKEQAYQCHQCKIKLQYDKKIKGFYCEDCDKFFYPVLDDEITIVEEI